jgi:hypothetical protein
MAKAKQKAKSAAKKSAATKSAVKKPAAKKAPAKKSAAKKSAAKKSAPIKPSAKAPVKTTTKRKTTPAKPSRAPKPTQKRKPPAPPAAPEQGFDALADIRDELSGALAGGDGFRRDPTVHEVAGRDAIHAELGAKLAAMRGDEQQERAAIASAIDSYMQLAITENGLDADASAYVAQCPEFFWEGDGSNPPVYARVPDATHDEIGRWFQLIVEGVRAYDSRVGATAPN